MKQLCRGPPHTVAGESEKLGDNPKHKSTVSGPYSARRTSNRTKRYCEAFSKLLFHLCTFRKVFIVHHTSKYTLCFSRFTQGKVQRRVAAGITITNTLYNLLFHILGWIMFFLKNVCSFELLWSILSFSALTGSL